MKFLYQQIQILFLVLLSITTLSLYSCKPDKCANVSCANGGACNGGVCVCPTGWEDASCKTESRAKFVSDKLLYCYEPFAHDSIHWGLYNSRIYRTPAASPLNTVVITNFIDSIFNGHPVFANAQGDSLTIPMQKPNNNEELYIDGKCYLSKFVIVSKLTGKDSISNTGWNWKYVLYYPIKSLALPHTAYWTSNP